MTKKYTTIEEQLTEGFWDAIVNKAKRVGLAAGAALGSNKSRGKLDANTFGTELYNQFKHWQGQTDAPTDMNAIAEFLLKQINMAPDFIEQVTGVNPKNDVGGGNDTSQQQQQQQQPSNQSDGFDDPLKHMDAGNNNGNTNAQSAGGPNGDAKTNYKPEEGDFVFDERNLKRYMESTWFTTFKNTKKASGFDKSPSAPFDKTKLDGAFLFSPTRKDPSLLADLKKAESDANAAIADLKQHNYFVTWDEFKSKVPGGDRIGNDTPEEADLFRQSWYQAYKEYDHVNYPENIDRFILSIPPRKVDSNATTTKPSVGTKFENFDESVDMTGELLMEKDVSDSKLRDFFMGIAKTALRDGQWKVAANRTMHQLRGDNIVGGAVQTNRNNGNNGNQQGNQQNNSGNDLLNKALLLGKVLGANINKFTLNDMRKKDQAAYLEFIKFLHDEKGSSFSPEFLEHAKKSLAPFFDFTKSKPDPSANQDINGGDAQSNDNKAQSNNTDDNQEGDANDGLDHATRIDGLNFYDIAGRKIAWDAKNNSLVVRTETPGGKASVRRYTRTESTGSDGKKSSGWVDQNNKTVPDKEGAEYDNWYDAVMQKPGNPGHNATQQADGNNTSGGDQANGGQAANSNGKIPRDASVVNPKNNGTYTFDGNNWRSGSNQVIPSNNAKFLNDLYHKKNGNDTGDSSPPEANKYSMPQEKESKPIPSGAKVTHPRNNNTYSFDGKVWTDLDHKNEPVSANMAHTLDYLYNRDNGDDQNGSNPNQTNAPSQAQNQQQSAKTATKKVPTGAELSHGGNSARKLGSGVWMNMTTKKPYPADKTAELDDLYRRGVNSGSKDAVAPTNNATNGNQQNAAKAPVYKLNNGKTFKQVNGTWTDASSNEPADPKTAMFLNNEYKKQQAKGATKSRMVNQAANDNQAAPVGAKFKQNDRGAEYTRTKDGWVDKNGKLNDNEAQVATLDRGYNNAKRNNGIRK
jgi:hypothetical protein